MAANMTPNILYRPETGPLGIMEDTILAKILDCLTLGDRESIALEEIIPPESENTETAAWSFSCVLGKKNYFLLHFFFANSERKFSKCVFTNQNTF